MRKPNARERILETATELFHKRGYSEVGINEIIEKAETAKASFYHYYPSKEALCEAWLSSVHEGSEIRRAEILKSPGTAASKIERYFEQLESYMISSEFRGCPYSNTCAVSDEGCGGVIELIRRHKESLRQFFREVCGQRFHDPEKAAEVGDRIFILYSGAATESQNMKDSWPIKVAAQASRDLTSP
ncbi:MAG: TetR/AcrR family transcriptional regulator [Verrucomicrobiales bacterium]